MDFDKETAELEKLVYNALYIAKHESVRATINSAHVTRAVAIWHQATWHALERAYIQGMKDAEQLT